MEIENTSKNMWRNKGRLNFPLNGLVMYSPLWHPEQQGFCMNFDGNDYLSNATADFRSGDSAGAIEVWFRTSTDADGALFSSCDTAAATSYFAFLVGGVSSVNCLLIIVRNVGGTTYAVRGTTDVIDGKWHHAVLSSSGTAWSMFLDGAIEPVVVASDSNSGDWFADITLRDNIAIGARVRNTTDYSMTGAIGWIRVYSREMLQPEAMTNFMRGRKAPASSTTGLVFNLPMTEGTGNPVDDVGSLTMAATGATWIESLSYFNNSTWTPMSSWGATWGITGRDFDGASSKIVVNGTVTGIKGAIVWIYPDDNTTRSIMDFDAGTHSIEMDGSGDLTATGWSSPTFYTNAVSGAVAITQSAWNLIMVTSATAFNGTAVVFGQEASYYDGKIGESWLYNREPSQADITHVLNATKWRYS